MSRFETYKLSSSQKLSKALMISGLVLILVLSVFVNPGKMNFSPCLFHKLTGLTCPSCGLTRSFYAISHLNFQKSIIFHPIGPVLFLTVIVLFLKLSFETIAQKKIKGILHPVAEKVIAGIVLAVWIGCWIARLFK